MGTSVSARQRSSLSARAAAKRSARTSRPAEAVVKALRFDTGKLRFDLLPHEWEEELTAILTKGAEKYADDNWKNDVNTERHDKWKKKCYACARRHILAYLKGERFDKESGREHLGHASWNLLAMMWYDINDRRKRGPSPQR